MGWHMFESLGLLYFQVDLLLHNGTLLNISMSTNARPHTVDTVISYINELASMITSHESYGIFMGCTGNNGLTR